LDFFFVCRPLDYSVSEDAGIEPSTVATMVLAVRRSNHSAIDLIGRNCLRGQEFGKHLVWHLTMTFAYWSAVNFSHFYPLFSRTSLISDVYCAGASDRSSSPLLQRDRYRPLLPPSLHALAHPHGACPRGHHFHIQAS
jgi:hypothetical protein